MGPFFRRRTFVFTAKDDDVQKLEAVPNQWTHLVTSILLRIEVADRQKDVEVEKCIQKILTLLPNLQYLRLDIRGVAIGWSLFMFDEINTQRNTPFRFPFATLPWVYDIAKHQRLQYFSTKTENRYDDWSDWRTIDEDRPTIHPDSYRICHLDWYVNICIAARRYSPDLETPLKGISHWKAPSTGWDRFHAAFGLFEHVSLLQQADIIQFLGQLFEHEGCGEGVKWCHAKINRLDSLWAEQRAVRQEEQQRRKKQALEEAMEAKRQEELAKVAFELRLRQYRDEVHRLGKEQIEKVATGNR